VPPFQSVKVDANTFIDDRGFGCKMSVQANLGEFCWILTPKIAKLLFDFHTHFPQKHAS